MASFIILNQLQYTYIYCCCVMQKIVKVGIEDIEKSLNMDKN